jgi:putative addiction module component (TIGR02574 family)
MDLAIPLDKMSVEEKLRAIECLWEDLARTPSAVPLPAWHRDVLEARLKRHEEGKEKSIPWEEARDRLRPRKT